MPLVTTDDWEPVAQRQNRQVLRAQYPEIYDALEELERLTNRLSERIPRDGTIDNVDEYVGLVFLSRTSTLTAGIRNLLNAAATEPVKPLIRALFELHLAVRFLTFGAKTPIDWDTTETSHLGRETRARYYYVAGRRDQLYTRQAVIDGAWESTLPDQSTRQKIQKDIDSQAQRLSRRYPAQWSNYGPLSFRGTPISDRDIHNYYDRDKWYSFLFRKTNIASVYRLAERLGMKWEYHFLYQPLSGLVHPTGVEHDLEATDSGYLGVFSPYMTEAFELLVGYSCPWIARSLVYLTMAYDEPSFSDAADVHDTTLKTVSDLDPGVPSGFMG